MNIELPHDWVPRTYQVPVWKYFQGPAEGKRAICVWHRRAGKDVLAINLIATKLFERVGTYWHCLPFYRQARDVVWNGKTREGRPFMSFFPKQLIKNKLNNEMRIHFMNPNEPDEDGSIYQAVGTDDKDRLVGTNPVGVVFSEYSLCDPAVWEYVRPILKENGGWALFIYTPRGHNHGYNLLQKNKDNPNWFVDIRKAGSGPECTKRHDGTPVFSDQEIEDELNEGMPYELAQQEYFVSFEASLVGAYYSKQMEKAEQEGRICSVAYDPKLPVETAWDIGWNDATAIIFFQRHFAEIRVIDFYESSGEGLPHYVRVMREKEYVYGAANFPHDLSVTEWASGKSRVEVARGLGLKVRIVPQHEVMDGIEQCRNVLPRVIFNGSKCQRLIDALKTYRKEWDADRKVFKDKPLHDWASNPCFTGDTKVLTHYGMRSISSLDKKGYILTPCGWKQYHSPRITQRDARLVQVAFKDGTTVRCTPEHLFLTENGWKSAECLKPNTLIQSSLTRSLSILMAIYTAYGQSRTILARAAQRFTETFGLRRLGPFLRTVISTTRTATQPITNWAILSAFQQRSTLAGLGTSGRKISPSIFQKTLEGPLLYGTGRRLEDYGTVDTQSGPRGGQSGSGKKSRVRCAAMDLWRWLGRMAISKNSALTIARPLIIESVRPLDYREDVWCLTVPDDHCFSLSNGAVVHNCDAFRYLCWTVKKSVTKNPFGDESQVSSLDLTTQAMYV